MHNMPGLSSYCKLVLLTGMLCINSSFAQQDTTRSFSSFPNDSVHALNPVTVYKVKCDRFISTLESPAPKFLLNEVVINDLGARDVGDVMKFVPGIQIKDYGGIGGLKTVRYRSLGGAHTGVVLDGNTQINTQTGTMNLTSFESFGLSSVAFYSGQPEPGSLASAYIPASVISMNSLSVYRESKFSAGAYQMLSTINFYETGLRANVPVGKRIVIDTRFLAKYGNGRYPYQYSLSGSDETFMRNNSRMENYKARVNVISSWDYTTLRVSAYYNNSQQQLPGAVVLYNPENDQTLFNEDLRLDLNGKRIFLMPGINSWIIKANVNAQSNKTTYEDPGFLNMQGFIRSIYLQHHYGFGLMNVLVIDNDNTIFLGTDGYYSDLLSNEFNNVPGRKGLNSATGFELKFWKRLSVEGNLSHQLIEDEARSADTIRVRMYNRLSPYLGWAFKPVKHQFFGVRSHYKRVFRMPSFNDLYYNYIGNSNLRPETADIFNFGVNFQFDLNKKNPLKGFGDILEFSVDGFYSMVSDKIVAIPTKNLFYWSMQNIGRTVVSGLDLSIIYTQKRNNWKWDVTTHFTLNQSVDVTDEQSPSYGHQIPYTPLVSGNATITVSWKGYAVTNNIVYSGQRYSLNQNIPANYLASYTDWNIGLSKNFEVKKQHNFFVSLKAMNVLNKNYEVIRSFPMPGRYYQLTFKYKFR